MSLVSRLFDLDAFTEPPIFTAGFGTELANYRSRRTTMPIFFNGEARAVLQSLPPDSFDCVMTSPPYWNKRVYDGNGIGLEENFEQFIEAFLAIAAEIHRVTTPGGSFWLNIGDTWRDKVQLAIPWRIAIRMSDELGWLLRESIVWNKVKGGPDQAHDRLRNVHEPIFHFVKSRNYYFNADAIRNTPKTTKVVNGSIVSATGVSGVRYRRQIELSTDLSPVEKENAFVALAEMLRDLQDGKIGDFRMIIRKQQRTTHSDSERVSGRARELRDKGFYFLRYHPNGSKPSDVWDILPEDTQNRGEHFAPYPEDLCRIPLTATCPPGGLVLDPFCGTGTTNLVAQRLGQQSVGIDLSARYLQQAHERCAEQ